MGALKPALNSGSVNRISEKRPDTQTVYGFMIAHHNLETNYNTKFLETKRALAERIRYSRH